MIRKAAVRQMWLVLMMLTFGRSIAFIGFRPQKNMRSGWDMSKLRRRASVQLSAQFRNQRRVFRRASAASAASASGWLSAVKAAIPAKVAKVAIGAACAVSSFHLLARGPRRDALVLLSIVAAVAPLMKSKGSSPILGFLLAGVVLGPEGLGVVSQVKSERALADLGVAIFLFDLGLQVSFDRLKAMRKQIVGLGLVSYVTSGILLTIIFGGVFGASSKWIVGFALALSSSVVGLQLLRDRDELATKHGRASFGALLFQDLAVVPLFAAMNGGVGLALVKAILALAFVESIGKRVLDGMFYFAARSRSQEAFLSVVLLTVISMSATTEALGLTATLGAFLAGLALSETRYRYQVEADIAPFRGLLIGLFFVTIGFSLDPGLLLSGKLWLAAIGLITTKALVTSTVSYVLGQSASCSLRTGLLLAPGSGLGIVALRAVPNTSFLQTTAALSMAVTPLLTAAGAKLAPFVDRLELERSGKSRTERDDTLLARNAPDVVVCGYGRVGKVVCEMLDEKLVDYICFDLDVKRATEAREKGKPVFFGDLGRPEVLEYFRVGSAKLVVVAVDGIKATNRVVVALRKLYPDLEIIARATNKDHQRRLNKMLGVVALVPTLPEDSRLLSLPFAGAVLRNLDYPKFDVDILIEEARRSALGIYDGFQSANLIYDEETTLLAQLGLNNSTDSAEDQSSESTNKVDEDTLEDAAAPTPQPEATRV